MNQSLSVHTNIIAPVVAIAQRWVKPGYRLIISPQTYHRVDEIAEKIGTASLAYPMLLTGTNP